MRHPAKVGCRFFMSAFFKTAALIGPDTSLHAARRFSAFKFFAPVVLDLPHRHLAIQRQALACPKSCPKTATYRSLRSLQLAALTPSAGTKHPEKSTLVRTAGGASARILHILCWQRAFRALHAVKGEHNESTHHARNDDHSATVLGS